MHRVAGQLVQGLKIAADRDCLYLRAEGVGLVRQFTNGEVKLAVSEDRPHRLKVEADWVAQDILTGSIPFSRLQVGAGTRVSLSLLVTDPAGHVIERHPGAGPFEIEVPAAGHDAVAWLI